MSFVIVPGHVSDAINRALDAALAGQPEAASACREHMFGQLLDYYNEHGEIPEFQVVKNPAEGESN